MSELASGHTVRDIIIDDEYSTIDSSATVLEAAELMQEMGVPDLVVLDVDEQIVIGVISDFNIINDIVAAARNPRKVSIKEATYLIEPVTLDTPIEEAFAKMQDLNVSVVPVVENGKVLGVCTLHDCWSFIPQDGAEQAGWVPVTSSQTRKFWFAFGSAIAAFILGILFPLMGIFGFFMGDTSALSTLFPTVDVLSNPLMHFYLFEAGGAQYLVDYYTLASIGGPAWTLMLVFGFALLASAILAIFSLFYSSFMSMSGFHAERLYERIFPVTTVIFIIFEWILMIITIAGTAPYVTLQVDPIGLTCSIIAIALLLLAIFRDRVIRV